MLKTTARRRRPKSRRRNASRDRLRKRAFSPITILSLYLSLPSKSKYVLNFCYFNCENENLKYGRVAVSVAASWTETEYFTQLFCKEFAPTSAGGGRHVEGRPRRTRRIPWRQRARWRERTFRVFRSNFLPRSVAESDTLFIARRRHRRRRLRRVRSRIEDEDAVQCGRLCPTSSDWLIPVVSQRRRRNGSICFYPANLSTCLVGFRRMTGRAGVRRSDFCSFNM